MVPRRGLSIGDKRRLMDAVNSVPALTDSYQRQQVLQQLHEEYGDAFDPAALGAQNNNWVIVDQCIRLGAMPELVSVLKFVGAETPQWRRLETLVAELFQGEVDDRLEEQVSGLLDLVPREAVEIALRHDSFTPYRSLSPADPGTATDTYQWLRAQPDPLAVIHFLEVVGHHLERDAAVELHRLTDDLAQRLGLTAQVRRLCKSLQTASTTPPGPAAEAQAEGSAHAETEGGDVSAPDVRSDESARALRVRPRVWGGVPPRNSNFTGRADLLGHIHESLHRHSQSTLVPQPLHGLGGIGKSQLAVEYAHRNQYDYELVWWIQGDDEQSIRRSLSSLARRLGTAESEDVQEIVDGVLDALRLGAPHEKWLLIYDNAPEPSVVQRYLPSGPGHVLVTSRSRSWSGMPNAIEIDVFAPEESVELLAKRWPELTEEEALTLAEQLGHLPLALEQAIAVHEQTGMPLADYLRALEKSPRVIMDEGAPANYPRSVAAALELAYKSVQESSPAAAALLKLCTFLSSQPISIPLLSRGRNALPVAELKDDILLRRAVRDLGRFALIQLDVGRDFIRIHALIRAVLRDNIPTEERTALQQSAHALLAGANPRDPDESATWTQHAQIAPHVVPSGLIYSLEQDVRQVVLDQIRYLFAIGDYQGSVDLGQSTVASWRAGCGPDDVLTLVATRHVANALRMLGRYHEAKRLNQATLERMNASPELGPDHEHTLETANLLAADLRLAGELHAAFRLDEQTLESYRSLLGERDPNTLRAMTNLAVDHRILGDFRTALRLDQANVDIRRDMFGDDHPRTLISYNCLIRDLYGLGQFHSALELAQQKMPVYEQKLPKNHNYVLVAKRNLAILLRKAGHHEAALEASVKLLDNCRRKFGRHHEHTLSAMLTLSNAYRVTGNLAKALEHGQSALTAYREVLGQSHPFTHACQVNVAIVLRLLGRNPEAAALTDEALAALTLSLGDSHPHTLCAAHTKANNLATDGRLQEAIDLGRQTLERSRLVRGEHHVNTLTCAANLSLDLEKLGELREANRLRRETLDQLGVQLGTDHPETMNAGVYRRMESDVEVPVM
ncbi:FxSxx-COOH system tetratricopeptide repeat protein [Actinocrispum sp. NPDC049592]|uniref:FxSxx-COOH system tetratricopeptide repeat protein n=1 Tax=Actinocrispum sp. NPDC049592 TaxID=3154835 RepID=UPI00342A19EE